ncbi:MAG: hypothetical protein QOI58_38 [Thermoanaerobaculia bacterium]|jgi:uncharacterized repeat protein (TIGR01451 family)|nr:hypothetical protein [Thermoanaerobaculia bacterium]
MSNFNRRNLRTILASTGVTVAALVVLLLLAVASDGSAQSCTDFTVVTSSTPANANWTDVAGLWTPSGSYPGRDTSCDTASDTTGTATVIVVNTAIPNPITGLNLSCATPGCVIDIQPGGSLTLNGPGTIGNGSKLRVSGGTLTIASGTLTFQNGALYEFTNGTVDIQSSATMDFTSGSSGVTTGGVMGGSGTLSISGGTLNIGSVTSPGTFSLTAGTLDGPGFLSIGQTFYWDGGTIKGSGGAELQGGGSGVLSGNIGTMLLDSRIFNNYGTIDYPATTNMLHLNNGAAFNTYGTFNFQDDGDIIADGPSSVGVFPNGVMQKHAGNGVSVIQPGMTNNSSLFVSHGTIELAGACPSTCTHNGSFFAVKDTFNGTIGTIVFSAPSATIDGSISGDGNVSFASGTTDYEGFFYLVDGETSITGATLVADSPISTSGFRFDSGELDLNNDVDMYGTGTWSGGTMSGVFGDGTFFVDEGAVLTIDAKYSVATIDTTFLENDGTINYTPGGSSLGGRPQRAVRALLSTPQYLELDNGSSIINHGLFDLKTDTQIAAGSPIIAETMKKAAAATAKYHRRTGRARTLSRHPVSLCGCANDFDNFGTFQKSADAGTTNFGPQFINDGGTVKALAGTINFQDLYTQNSGTTTLGPGAISVQSPNTFDMEGGILNGSGTITGDVDNYGAVKPGTATTVGTITITGNFAMGASPGSGEVDIKIAGPATGQFDQLNIDGTATLDATFNGSFINGYTPATGTTTWPVITYASETGAFTTVNPPTYYGGAVTYAYNPTSFDLTAFTPTADVKVANSGPAAANTGATLTYTVNVSNLGPQPTSGTITVTDSATGGATPVGGSAASDWTCSIVSGSIQCTTASTSLANGGSLPPITFTWTAPASPATVVNTASVPNSVADPVPSNNSASVTTAVGPQANLSITKTVVSPAPPNPVNPGQNITYSIVVQNNGPLPATGVTVSDPTPTGIAFLSVTGSTCTSFPCSIGTLNNGQSVTLTSMYNVPPSYSGGPIVNTASVSAIEGDPNIADNQSTTTTNVGAAADVAISKTGPPAVSLGQNITYTISVSNFGPAGATGVTVSDTTPSGLTPVSVSGGGCSAFPCVIGALAVGPPVTITATYNVPVTYSGPSPILNTATVTSASDPNSSNNSSTASTTIAAQSDLGITKSGPASIAVGQNITYTINITNTGALAAANTFVSDPTPPGLTPVSVSGGGCSAFPCALGTINPGGSVAITAIYNVSAGSPSASVTNTASVSTSSPESNLANNSSTVITPVSNTAVADLSILKAGPAQAAFNDIVNFSVIVTNNGPSTATNVVISDPTPSNLVFISNSGACTTPYPCTIPSIASIAQASIVSRYRVTADTGTIVNISTVTSSASDPVPGNNSSSSTVAIVKPATCPAAPVLNAPVANTTVASPITFSWSSVPGATYIVSITSGGITQTVATNSNSTTQNLANGAYTWSVQANGPSGCSATSSTASFSVCNAPGTPVPSVVGVTTTGQTYNVEWTATEGTTLYELQEAGDPAFTNPTTIAVPGTSQSFTKNITVPTTFFYRVRALAGCNPTAGSFSAAAPIVIIPVPPLGTLNISIPVPAGSKTPVSFPIHVPGLPNVTTSFIATVDKPWLSVAPSNGVMPPEGLNFTVSADPSALSDGTWTGTVIIVYGSSGVTGNKQALDVAPKTSIPVSISLTSPVSPGTLTGASATALVIPSVGHLPGFSSQWQSDIRIANITALSKKVQLTFNSGSATSLAVKQTTVSIDPGSTIAFDDIVRNWFGIGAMNDSSNGVLTVQPLDATGKPDLSINKAAAVSSRTFNASAAGTLGQFIPGVPLANFISKAPGAVSILALQQIAQTDTFHTNLGLVEATGKSASVLVSVFNGAGNKVLDLPITLAAGEQRQLNGFLANNGITLTNGHIEVAATGGDGKVTAYASVIDNRTTDPLLVSGVPLGGVGATRYVIPGVASLDTGATWRSDVRVFNSSLSPQTATLTLYPTGNPSASVTQSVTIQPGEVKALDDIVHSTFNLSNAGGALHVTTAVAAPLVVTARTFNDTAAGTLGQFLQAVTPADAVGTGERSLQLLQMEDSPRYRTNLGLAEVTGKPATAEITVILPDSKVAPKVSIPLAAFEYRQFPIISSLGLGNVYNARISVKVIDGQGKVTAYGSVIDQKTQDPTFVPAQ